MHPIFVLVGPTGAGKTTLILELIQRFPGRLSVVKSLTTRPRRGEDDDLFYDFVNEEELRRREQAGRLVQISEYAEHLYAHDREHINAILAQRCGVCALVEQGVQNLRHAGYQIIVVKIIPVHNPVQIPFFGSADGKRQAADAMRAQIQLPADLILNNSFETGGKEKAVEQLGTFVSDFIGSRHG